ncbi:ACT domain-containing protein [Butyricicoccus sp. 1XD8-22]|nr:ACT domain-containing protein [Butyricicoccus sp. 1XD8-22]
MQGVDTVKQPEYYLVERSLLPEVFRKVVEANAALKNGRAKTAAEAAQSVGLSRSAFYKYKDGVRPFYEATTGRVITFHLILHDQPGTLSSLLQLLAQSGANLLTINQSVPMSGQASVTIAVRTSLLVGSVEDLMRQAGALDGVQRIEIVASE